MSVSLSLRIESKEDSQVYDPIWMTCRWQWNRDQETKERKLSKKELGGSNSSFMQVTLSAPSVPPSNSSSPSIYLYKHIMLIVTLYGLHRKVKSAVQIEQKLGTCQILLNQIQSKKQPYFSIGVDYEMPSFAVFVDMDQCSCVTADGVKIKWSDYITRQKTGVKDDKKKWRATHANDEALRDYTRKDKDKVFQFLISANRSGSWLVPSLFERTIMYDIRDVHVWSGNMIPHLFAVRYQKEPVYTPLHTRYYESLLAVTMDEMGIAAMDMDRWCKEGDRMNSVDVDRWGEILCAMCARSSRLCMYANDTVYKTKSFQHESKQGMEAQETEKSWRAKEVMTNPYGLGDLTPTSNEVSQSGDQITMMRTFPHFSAAQGDCDDMAFNTCVEMMHLKEMIRQGLFLHRPHACFWNSFVTQYTPVVAICTMNEIQDLPADERLSYLRSFENTTAQQKTDKLFIQHVISISFPSSWLKVWIERGLSIPSEHSVSPSISHSVITMESVADFKGCPHSTLWTEHQARQAYKLEEFYTMIYTHHDAMPRPSMWKFEKPQSVWNKGRLYGLCATLYVAKDEDNGQMHEGQFFWFNTQTKKYGIVFEDMQKLVEIEKNADGHSPWCLIQVGSETPLHLSRFPSSFAQEEKRPGCFRKDGQNITSSVPPTESIFNRDEDVPLFMYCRRVDWDEYGSAFKEWCLAHKSTFRVGVWDSVQKCVVYSKVEESWNPTFIDLNSVQPIVQLCIHMK